MYLKVAAVEADPGPPAVEASPKMITFYYTVSSFFDLISSQTMYATRNLKNEDTGESLIDELAITEDERDWFMIFLQKGTEEVFNKLTKYATGIDDSIFFNETYNQVDNCVGVSLLDKSTNNIPIYNPNLLNRVSMLLSECIQYWILKEWFAVNGIAPLVQKFESMFLKATASLINASFKLKVPPIAV